MSQDHEQLVADAVNACAGSPSIDVKIEDLRRTSALSMHLPLMDKIVITEPEAIEPSDVEWHSQTGETHPTTDVGNAEFEATAGIEGHLPPSELGHALSTFGVEISDNHEGDLLVTASIRLRRSADLCIEVIAEQAEFMPPIRLG